MNRIKKPKFNEKDLGVNPFVQDLVIKVNMLRARDKYEKVEGEELLLPLFYEVEDVHATRVYCTPNHRKIVSNLSPKGKSLYLWLIYDLDYNKDFLWLNKVAYMEENSISSNTTYTDSVKELIRYGILGYTVVKDVFWINPDFFFQGNRPNKYSHRLKHRDQTQTIEM